MKEKTIIFQYNVDSDGNPTSTNIEEIAQVSPLKYTIQLEQIPDEQYGVILLNEDNSEMVQVFNYDEVETIENSYYVNYTNGIVYFNSVQGSEKKVINYYGTGVELISCKRIFDGYYDANGKWVTEILQDIIDAGREAIKLMTSVGDIATILQLLETKIAEGDAKLQELQNAIDEANDLTKVTGNEEVIINTSDWVSMGNGEYYAIVNHSCASEKIHVTFKRTISKENVLLGYTIIDDSSFKVFSHENVQTSCIINAMYYRATQTISDDIAQEVIDARGAYSSLNERFNAINTSITSIETKVNNVETELGSVKTELNSVETKIEALEKGNGNVGGSNTSSIKAIYTFNDFAKAVINGEEFKIAFYGDSTVDGNTTTGYVANTIGNISSSKNTFSNYLQNYIEVFTNNTKKNIINAGFSGKDASWGNANFENHFLNGNISNVKMIGIGFGINDRLGYKTEKSYYQGFYNNIKSIIEKCFDNNIQPFLLTTQAISEVGGDASYDATYPLRNTYYINACANQAKKDLAKLYGLELIDLNSFTEDILTISNYNINLIMKDNLHFTDLGHKLEAGYIFKHIFDNCIVADGNKHISFSNQKIKTDMKMGNMVRTTSPNFKTSFNYNETTVGKKVMDFWIFNYKPSRKLVARKNGNSKMTCLINENETTIINDNQIITDLDMGLYHIIVKNKEKHVDFMGFSILDSSSNFAQNGITFETTDIDYSLTDEVLTVNSSSSRFAPMFIKKNDSYCNQLFIDTSNFLEYNLGKTFWLVLGGTENNYIAISFTNNMSTCQGIFYNVTNKSSGRQLTPKLETLIQFNCSNKLLISVIEDTFILTNAFGETISANISSYISGYDVKLGLMFENGGSLAHMPFKLKIS